MQAISDPLPENPSRIPPGLALQSFSGCNSRCIMCAYKDTHIRGPHQSMAMDLFCKIIDEFADLGALRSTALSLQCEPLLDKELCRRIAYIKNKSASAQCAITTNALLLTSDKARELSDCGLDHVAISLNAVSQKTFSLVCGVSGYDDLMKNICSLLEKKPDTFSISFNSMLVKENFMELFQKKHPLLHRIKESGFPHTMGPISNHCGGLSNYEQHLVLPQFQGSGRKLYCHDIFDTIYVLCNGDVLGCCSDFRRKCILGNLSSQNFMDIWKSGACESRRQDMMTGNLQAIEPCSQCSQAWNIMKNRENARSCADNKK